MSIKDQKLSEREEPKDLKPMELFTDRTEPQEAFERKLALIDEYKADAMGVLMFYGIGGVGKTSLMNKLCHLLNGDPLCNWRLVHPTDCNYAVFDFGADGVTKDPKSILTQLKNQLEEKGYEFFLFNTALVLYAKKVGISYEDDKSVTTFLDRYPLLSGAVSAVGIVPMLNWVSDAIQAFDQSFAGMKQIAYGKTRKKKYEEELAALYGMEAQEILSSFPKYFITDMRMNMADAKKPLVIFLDTYEKYIDTLQSDTISIIRDYWLWNGSQSVIRSIPGILWVIFGRESLKWMDSADIFWKCGIEEKPFGEMTAAEKQQYSEENLEQHLLGDLSEMDSILFMKRAGIEDSSLCRALYQTLTGGTPLYIDICVKQYLELKRRKIPELSDFGKDKDELINRYLGNMPPHYREMSYFLAILGSWTDEEVCELSGRIGSIKGFTRERYRDYIGHSFVIGKPDGTRYLHEVVRECYLENAGDALVADVREQLEKWLFERLKSDSSAGIARALSAYVGQLPELDLSEEALLERWDTLQDALDRIVALYDLENILSVSRALFEYLRDAFPGSLLLRMAAAEYMHGLCFCGNLKAGAAIKEEYFPQEGAIDTTAAHGICKMNDSVSRVCVLLGKYKESLAYTNAAYNGFLELYGNKHPDTLQALTNLAVALAYLGDKVTAWGVYEKVYAIRKEILGEDDPATLTSLNSLAEILARTGDYDSARELYKEVYEKRKELLGEDHPDTITAYSNLALTIGNLGDRDTEERMHREIYEKRCRILGEDHPDTLRSANNLAVVLDKKGEKKEAEPLYEKVYRKRLELLGEDHPDTLAAMSSYAIILRGKGEFEAARDLLLKVYEKRTEQLGADHEDTVHAATRLARTYQMMDDRPNAKKYSAIAYRLNKHDQVPVAATTPLRMNDRPDAKKQFGIVCKHNKFYQSLDDPATNDIREILDGLNLSESLPF